MIKRIVLGSKNDQVKAARNLEYENARHKTLVYYYSIRMFCGYGNIKREGSYQPYEIGYISHAAEETHNHSYPGPRSSNYFAFKYNASNEDFNGVSFREIFSQTTSCKGIDGQLWDLNTPEIKALLPKFLD